MIHRRAIAPFAALAVAALTALSCANPYDPAPRNDVHIVIGQGAVSLGVQGFSPNPIVRATSNATVTWVNHDFSVGPNGALTGTVHRVISDEALFDAGNIQPDSSFSFTFPGPGVYHYHCLNHPGMTGTIESR
jgi:plastocyanin